MNLDQQIIHIELLKKLGTLLDRHGIKYWLDGGTLLCAYRDGNLDNEHDIDIGIFGEDYAKLISLNSEIEKELGVLVQAYEPRLHDVIYDKNMKPMIDIISWHKLDEHVRSCLAMRLPFTMPIGMFNFVNTFYFGSKQSFPIPQQTEEYLRRYFGNWKESLNEEEYTKYQEACVVDVSIRPKANNPYPHHDELWKVQKRKFYPKVTAYISTAGRYHTTLPLAITSLCMQTYKPAEFILYDDGEQKDLRKHPMYQYLFGLLDQKGIKWSVGFGSRSGQVKNHQKALEEANTEWLWRLDDDNIAEPDCLETLVSNITTDVGAVAGLVLHPNQPVHHLPSWYSHNKIEYCEDPAQLNIQWFKQTGLKSVDHLYSTFIYKKEAALKVGGYNMDLSPVGHREESLLTYAMKHEGYNLLLDPRAVTWHFRYSEGGIRGQHHTQANFDHDAQIFLNKLKEWGVVLKRKKLIALDCGLGDHLAFKNVLPEIKAKYPDLILSVCYPEVFKDEGVQLISIAEANCNLDEHSIYKFMWDRDWKNTIVEAYREKYVNN